MAFICDSRQRFSPMTLIWQSSGAASGADLNHVFCKEHFINVPEPQHEKAPQKKCTGTKNMCIFGRKISVCEKLVFTLQSEKLGKEKFNKKNSVL